MNLDLAMRQVLLELELVSAGTTYSYNGSGGGGDGRRPPVSGDSSRPALLFAREWQRAGERRRSELFEEAQTELKRLRGQFERPETKGETDSQWRDRLILEGAGWEASLVAVRFQTSVKVVQSVRLDRGCMPGDGREIALPRTDLERVERVRELVAQRATVREIEALLKIPRSTVQRIIKRAA